MDQQQQSTSKVSDLPSFSRPGKSITQKVASKPDGAPGRLPSLRGPRDLTLGGIKKKTFSPTIPQRKQRVKTEDADFQPSMDKKSRRDRDRNRDRSRRSDRGRGRGRGRARFQDENLIQSHSIFESGPSATASSSRGGRSSFGTGGGSGGGGGGGSSSATIQKPTIDKNESFDISKVKKESEEAIAKLEAGSESFITGIHNDEKMKPLLLPMKEIESKLFIDNPTIIADDAPKLLPRTHPARVADVFKNVMDSKLVLFQIPDSLPGNPPSVDDGPHKSDASMSSVEGTTKKNKVKDYCSLEDYPEGPVGKLQVYKSGRCRLILGDIAFDMRMGTPSSFYEELVSIRLPPEGSAEDAKGHLSILGQIKDKVVCVPDMTSLVIR